MEGATGADTSADAALAAGNKGLTSWVLLTPNTSGSRLSSTAKTSFPMLARRFVAVGARTSLKPCTSPRRCMSADALLVWPLKMSLLPCSLRLCSAVSSGSTCVSLSNTLRGSMRPLVNSDRAPKASTADSNCSRRCTTAAVPLTSSVWACAASNARARS